MVPLVYICGVVIVRARLLFFQMTHVCHLACGMRAEGQAYRGGAVLPLFLKLFLIERKWTHNTVSVLGVQQ